MTMADMETGGGLVHKSEKLAEIGREAGWEAQIIPEFAADGDPRKIKWTVTFIRKPELMKVVYVGERFIESTYVCGDKITTPHHKGAVVRVLLGTPDLRFVGNETLHEYKNLPFDPKDPNGVNILRALIGRRITWVNSLSSELDTEVIDVSRNKGSKLYRLIRTADGRRYIEFVTNHGFRAVYLDAIVSAI